jgi:hypothetical protein
MATNPSLGEEAAIALPPPLLEGNRMAIMVPLEGGLKSVEFDAVALLCVALGLLHLSNHPRIHEFSS